MSLKLILQGLTSLTHEEALNNMLNSQELERVLISVAFISEGGVELLEKHLAPIADKVQVFAGIRNEITSAQAMNRLRKLGVTLYGVDTGSRMLVFHPKIYYARSQEAATLSVGSANLTLGGLNNNIEAGVILELDLKDERDVKFSDELEHHFDNLPQAHPQNVIRVETKAQIKSLLKSGRLVDERTLPPPRPSSSSSGTADDPTPRMKMEVPRKSRKPKAAKAPAAKGKGGSKSPSKANASVPSTGVTFDLVWISKELERRDLNIPKDGTNTNATGSINLDKGEMEESVDHRHYFREEVFAGLDWPKKSGAVDTATADFALTIKGIDYGTFELTVRHTTSTTSATYKQRNAMTRLSWGAAKDYVRNKSLLGRHLALYRDRADPTSFMLEID